MSALSLLKTLWEKEKLLLTSNFSFSHSVFYSFLELSAIFTKVKIVVCKLFQFGSVQNLLFGKGLRSAHIVLTRITYLEWCTLYHTTLNDLNPFPNKPWFLRVCITSLLKTLWEKEKLLVTNNFSFSHSVFYPFEKISAILIKFEIVVCKLFEFERV